MSNPNDGVARRFSVGLSGQAFLRVIYAINTIALVPIMIHAWGLEGYGEWIALTALASYFGYSNFGLVTTSVNEMVMAVGANDAERAGRTFRMSINFALYIVLPLLLLFMIVVFITPVASILHLSQIGRRESVIVLGLCALQLWFTTVRGIMVAALYATGSYGFAYFISGLMKLLELAGVATIVVFLHGRQASAAAFISFVALVELIVVGIAAYRAASWARLDLRLFDRKWLSTQFKPALGFLLSSLSAQGVIVQGPRVLLSATLGAQAVGLFAVYATAMRLLDQILLSGVLPLEVEIARNVGRGDLPGAYRLVNLGTQLSWILFFCVASGMSLFGPFIFRFWTQGRIDFSYVMMTMFLVMSAGNVFGRVCAHALMSANRMYGPSMLMLVASILAVAFGALMTRKFGIPGMVLGVTIGELAGSMVAVYAVTRWLDRTVVGFVLDLSDLRPVLDYAHYYFGKLLSLRNRATD